MTTAEERGQDTKPWQSNRDRQASDVSDLWDKPPDKSDFTMRHFLLSSPIETSHLVPHIYTPLWPGLKKQLLWKNILSQHQQKKVNYSLTTMLKSFAGQFCAGKSNNSHVFCFLSIILPSSSHITHSCETGATLQSQRVAAKSEVVSFLSVCNSLGETLGR